MVQRLTAIALILLACWFLYFVVGLMHADYADRQRRGGQAVECDAADRLPGGDVLARPARHAGGHRRLRAHAWPGTDRCRSRCISSASSARWPAFSPSSALRWEADP